MIVKPADRLIPISEYYFSKKLAEIRKLEDSGHEVINLGIGSPDLPPSEEVLKMLCESALEVESHGYQSYRGIPELRKAIAAFYQKTYGVSGLNFEEELLPLMGSKEGIMQISLAFLNEGDTVLLPNPGYPTYTSVTKLVGGIPVYYDLREEDGWQIDVEELKKKDLDAVKLLWINTPHMPTGTVCEDDVLVELIGLARKHKFLIVCDNPYSMVLTQQPKSILQIAGAEEVTLELNSLSKSHNMAGWRVGWVVGKGAYLNEILKVKSNMDSGMFLPLQKAAVVALSNSEQWHLERNNKYAERRKKACELLDLLGCRYAKNQVGMFVWAKAPKEQDNVAVWIDKLIYEAGVFLTPGFIFGTNGASHIRISLCSSIAMIEKAIQKIKRVI